MKKKFVFDEAYGLLTEWRNQGVPEFITAYEAHTLTNGLVGKEYGSTGATKEMALAQVAIKLTKLTA
jgi:hypothetical protein